MWLFCSNMFQWIQWMNAWKKPTEVLVVIKVYRISEMCQYTVHFDVIKRCALDSSVYIAQSAQFCKVKQDLLYGWTFSVTGVKENSWEKFNSTSFCFFQFSPHIQEAFLHNTPKQYIHYMEVSVCVCVFEPGHSGEVYDRWLFAQGDPGWSSPFSIQRDNFGWSSWAQPELCESIQLKYVKNTVKIWAYTCC